MDPMGFYQLLISMFQHVSTPPATTVIFDLFPANLNIDVPHVWNFHLHLASWLNIHLQPGTILCFFLFVKIFTPKNSSRCNSLLFQSEIICWYVIVCNNVGLVGQIKSLHLAKWQVQGPLFYQGPAWCWLLSSRTHGDVGAGARICLKLDEFHGFSKLKVDIEGNRGWKLTVQSTFFGGGGGDWFIDWIFVFEVGSHDKIFGCCSLSTFIDFVETNQLESYPP